MGSGLLLQLAAINAVLGAFNLLPALPMDGGRIFRGLLQTRLGYLRATRIAARTARVLAVAMGLAGLVWNPMLVFIALLVWWMAGQEEAAARRWMRGRSALDPAVVRLWQETLRRQRAGPAGARRPRASSMIVDVS